VLKADGGLEVLNVAGEVRAVAIDLMLHERLGVAALGVLQQRDEQERDDRRDCVDHELPRIHVGEHEADNDAVERGPIRDMHKVVKLARQPGGLKTLTDVELSAYVSWLRDGADDRSRDKKARKGFQQSLGEAEAEAARRNL
jgi:hypothetical protein